MPKEENNANDLEAVHRTAMERMNSISHDEYRERARVVDDMTFVNVPGAMWDNGNGNHNRNSNQHRGERPRYEVDKISPIIANICGEQQQNRTTMKIRSMRGAESKPLADNAGGVIRYIEQTSNFKHIKDVAFKEIVTGGMGGWYISLDYADTDSTDQDITIRALPGAASSLFYDTAAVMPNKEDATWMMVVELMARTEFERRWPDKLQAQLDTRRYGHNVSSSTWYHKDTIRIGDYYTKEPFEKELVQMSNGDVYTNDDDFKAVQDELAEVGITIVKRRKRTCYKIYHYKVSGNEILEGPHEWPGELIPIVPLFGHSVYIEGTHYFRGIVRPARDSQEIYNYSVSAQVEVAANSPVSPIFMTLEQGNGSGIKEQFANLAVENRPVVYYKGDPEANGPPSRTVGPQLPAGIFEQIRQSESDIQATAGFFAASQGDAQFDQSGRAVNALQKQTSISTQGFTSSLDGAIEHTGKIILDILPKVVDTARLLTIIGDDGEISEWSVNQQVFDEESQTIRTINDLSKLKLSVKASTGPSFATQRAESVNSMLKLMALNPDVSLLGSDILVSNIDMDASEELTNRLRRGMIAKGLIQPNEEELLALQSVPPQEPSVTEQIQQEMLKLDLEFKALTNDQVEEATSKIRADAVHKLTQAKENLDKSIAIRVKVAGELSGGVADFVAKEDKQSERLLGSLETSIQELERK